MPDPADKTDDLIAELAKLMATAPGGSSTPAVQPIAKPAPLASAPTLAPAPSAGAAPSPIRIPGMDGPRQAAVPASVAGPTSQPEQRGPATGTIRIPGMDQPPVSTSVPVGKFDFGVKPAMTPIKQEPLSSFTDRLQAGRNLANDPAPRTEPQMAPIRIPSDLKPVSENRSFAEGPALAVARPAPAPMPTPVPIPEAPPVQSAFEPDTSSDDFHFDFGFDENPPPSAAPQQPRTATPASAEVDPIAALIEADLADNEAEAAEEFDAEDEPEVEIAPEPPRATQAAVVTPMIRAVGPVPVGKPAMTTVSSAQPRAANSQPIPLKPVSVAPRSPESDRFAISPGVGLNMRPPAGQPLNPQARAPQPAPQNDDDSDPMSEIESLIGEAVRVELTPGPVRVQSPQQVAPKVQFEQEADLEREIGRRPQQQTSAPVVPPLTTAFAPRRANLKDESGTNSAEDAILAAAAASGAEVGRIEPNVGDESPYRRLKVKPQRSSFLSGGMRQYVGMAVAGTLLLAAGLGLYWVLNMGRTANINAATSAPQLTADATPVKVKPAPAAKPATDAATSPVLAKMGGTQAAPSAEQLVSTDQTNGGNVTRDVTATGDTGENGLANRKVRTVTVRPDGTIVSGDDALAGGAELSVDRPNVPAVPSTETTNLLGNETDVAATDPLVPDAATQTNAADATTQVADATEPVIDPTAVAPKPVTFPVKTATTEPLAFSSTKPANTQVNAVVGAQTPNGQIDLLGGTDQPQQVASAAPAPKTPVAAANTGNAPAYVQLSSQPTQADAQTSIKTMTARYGDLFGGNKLTIQQVDLGQKGIKWRVRLPTGSLNDAATICSQIKAQGGDCFPTKG
jgi:hypothetical protein